MPELSLGGPEVIAGAEGLDRPVRWVHVSEVTYIADLLSGGEMILTTGINLPGHGRELQAYTESLVAAGVSSLVVELGRRFHTLPEELVAACAAAGRPLVALRNEIRFVKVTEEVHARIIEGQTAELRRREQIHDTFTQLGLGGATAAQIVEHAAAMAQCPILLESSAHHLLAMAGGDTRVVATRWAHICRGIPQSSTTELLREGWMVTPVGARGEVWGRLAMSIPDGAALDQGATILERAAMAIAINRLAERSADAIERQTHRSLLLDILSGAQPLNELEMRMEAVGVPVRDRLLMGCVIRVAPERSLDPLAQEAHEREIAENVARAARQSGVSALVGPTGHGDVAALLATTRRHTAETDLNRFAQVFHRTWQGRAVSQPVVGAGSAVEGVAGARRSLREAAEVVDSVAPGQPFRAYHRLPDVRLRGLLYTLRSDERVRTFCERELGALLAYDQKKGTDLVRTLRAYLDHGRNKSETAAALNRSRPALYERLRLIAAITGFDLESVESCLSLQVALLCRDQMERTGWLSSR